MDIAMHVDNVALKRGREEDEAGEAAIAPSRSRHMRKPDFDSGTASCYVSEPASHTWDEPLWGDAAARLPLLFTTLPSDMLHVIVSQTSLSDYFCLAHTNRAVRAEWTSGPISMAPLLRQISETKARSGTATLLANIAAQPSMWQPTLFRLLSACGSANDVRRDSDLDRLWRQHVSVAWETHRLCGDPTLRHEGARDLIIAYAEHGGMWEVGLRQKMEQWMQGAVPELPMSYWPTIFAEFAGGIVEQLAVWKEFVRSYHGTRPSCLHRLAEPLVRTLTSLSELPNLNWHLEHRFSASTEFQRIHLDKWMIGIIMQNVSLTYDSVMRACIRWRPGDVAFQQSVEAEIIEKAASFLLMDRRSFVDDMHRYKTFLADPLVRPAIGQFLLAAEHETVEALDGDPTLIRDFLALCERISCFNHEDSLSSLIDVAANAPWQMRPVLFHRLVHLLDGMGDRGAVLNAADKADRAMSIECLGKHLDLAAGMRVIADSSPLSARILAARIAWQSNNSSVEHWERYGNQLHLLMALHGDAIATKDWEPVLKVIANRPESSDKEVEMIEGQGFKKAALRYVNYFLRDPDAKFSNMDAFLFLLVGQQVPEIWHLLPESVDSAAEGLAAIARRLGLSERQQGALKKSILDYQVTQIWDGQSTIEEMQKRIDLGDEVDTHPLEDELWTSWIQGQLSLSETPAKWLSELIETSPYLQDKARNFLEPFTLPDGSDSMAVFA